MGQSLHYTEATNVSQKIWVKVNYTAPASLKSIALSSTNVKWLINCHVRLTLNSGIRIT